MKRNDFTALVQPLTERLYQMAFALVPDDLQAEQLVIDGVNAFLIREKKYILLKKVDLEKKKDVQTARRTYYKGILRCISDIGLRRAAQLSEQLKKNTPEDFEAFYSLEPRIRLIMKLRYEAQFTVEEIEDVVGMPRYEVIEKIHNGRFLLTNQQKVGVNV